MVSTGTVSRALLKREVELGAAKWIRFGQNVIRSMDTSILNATIGDVCFHTVIPKLSVAHMDEFSGVSDRNFLLFTYCGERFSQISHLLCLVHFPSLQYFFPLRIMARQVVRKNTERSQRNSPMPVTWQKRFYTAKTPLHLGMTTLISSFLETRPRHSRAVCYVKIVIILQSSRGATLGSCLPTSAAPTERKSVPVEDGGAIKSGGGNEIQEVTWRVPTPSQRDPNHGGPYKWHAESARLRD